MYELLATLTLIIHFLFIIFVIFGGLLFFNDSWIAWNFILLRCLYCYPRLYFSYSIFSKTKFKIGQLTLTMESN